MKGASAARTQDLRMEREEKSITLVHGSSATRGLTRREDAKL